MYCSPTTRHTAIKPHRCHSCGEDIAAGEAYMRWRCYDNGRASTAKMHEECYAMHDGDAYAEWEYEQYGHERPARGEP
jgi:predicted RNA-binding Zn-ribbon protein involved in translation (DUF1610 family)